MKATIKVELDFESYFSKEREPKTKKEWSDFFINELFSHIPFVIGKDMIALDSITITEVESLTKQNHEIHNRK